MACGVVVMVACYVGLVAAKAIHLAVGFPIHGLFGEVPYKGVIVGDDHVMRTLHAARSRQAPKYAHRVCAWNDGSSGLFVFKANTWLMRTTLAWDEVQWELLLPSCNDNEVVSFWLVDLRMRPMGGCGHGGHSRHTCV